MTRTVPLLSLAITVVVATWWLGEVPNTTAAGASPLATSVDALHALWAIQIFSLVLLGPRLGTALGGRAAALALAGGIALSWPLAALIWSATPLAGWSVLRGELWVIATSLTLPMMGELIARTTSRLHAGLLPSQTLVSVASVIAASLLWWTQAEWLAWLA